jgi:hypothetical protein
MPKMLNKIPEKISLGKGGPCALIAELIMGTPTMPVIARVICLLKV